ncbi:DUF7009 family protein [Paraliomyxa miuraensis]|uniref:DUF7009 family protein n=1 Tax=Paraliomyxa miuraensis TaxID=376150 RepID=UPI002254CB49|nr:hypothetical protein [Paraliomyxa miuraensis]MCX4246129.1 hypothetical protein [Paraliomyxa miuraensis]
MKLRILDDTLRLRLPKSELDQLGATGRVEAVIHFGPGPEQRLVYALVVDREAHRISATFTAGEIAVHLPADRANTWAEGDEVGLYAEQSLGNDRHLSLAIEKDFKCLVPRQGEEDYDGFSNPKAAC